MTRSAVAATAITAVASNGYNLTDSSDFTTMSTGAGNGVEIARNNNYIIILKNTTGGDATFSLVMPTQATLETSLGGVVTDPTITVVTTKSHIMPVFPTAVEDGDGNILIDCDVAALVLVLNLA